MPKRSSKKDRLPDPNQLAFSIVQAITGEPPVVPLPDGNETVTDSDGKNPAAVILGRLGGLKGGFARAKKLSKKVRSDIARKAALVRWEKKHGEKKA